MPTQPSTPCRSPEEEAMMTRWRQLLVFLGILVWFASSVLTAQDSRYRLRSGDVLGLNFPFVPDFNQTVTVQPDGFVTLRALGSIHIDRMTVPELSEKLRSEYSAILRDPVVTVELKEFEKPYFVVSGEVERPGRYELRSDTTATQALAMAGGGKDRAKYSEAVIFRRLPEGGVESRPLDLKTMLKERR